MDHSAHRLKEIAEVTTGQSFRARLEPSRDGEVGVIQMRDLGEDGTVDVSGMARIHHEPLNSRSLVRKGDIIFKSRGLRFTAALLDEPVDNTIVAGPLLRVRVYRTARVVPRYLTWWINKPSSQAHLKARAEGSGTIKMITKRELEGLEVLLPSPERQQLISKLAALALREREFSRQLERLRETRLQKMLSRLVSGDMETPESTAAGRRVGLRRQ